MEIELDNKIKDKKVIVISMEEALKDIIPIKWSKDVLNENKKETMAISNK